MNRPEGRNRSGRPRSKRGEAASICFTPLPSGYRVAMAYEKGRAWAICRWEFVKSLIF
jgi:hypothetical protein